MLSGNSSPATNSRYTASRPGNEYRDSAKDAIEPSVTASPVATTAITRAVADRLPEGR